MKKNKSVSNDGEKSSSKELNPPPDYLATRLIIWDKLKAQYEDDMAKKAKELIKVTLPDGKEIEGTAWTTTAYDIAKGIRFVYLSIIMFQQLNFYL